MPRGHDAVASELFVECQTCLCMYLMPLVLPYGDFEQNAVSFLSSSRPAAFQETAARMHALHAYLYTLSR